MRFLILGLIIIGLWGCKKEIPNNPPEAAFIVEPLVGNTETRFLFNASTSTDSDQEDSLLWVRWDWQADGYYDCFFVKTKQRFYQFEEAGTYVIRLQIKDLQGETSTTEHTIEVLRGSAPPLEPFSPNPRDSSNHIIFQGRLSWVAVDPDDDPMVFDVYLGTISNPPLVATGIVIDEYYPENIIPGKEYYWRVVARDELNEETSGPIWRFSSHSGQYELDSLVDPRDGQVYSTVLLNGMWWMTENLKYNLEGNSYCVENLPENCDKYGRYYNTWLPDTTVCPKGWFYPSQGQWGNLESYLGMTHDDIRKYGVWRGSDQAYQILENGTSGLNFMLTGYRDREAEWHFVDECLYFGNSSRYGTTRMAIKGYGGILRSSFYEAGYVPVRCVKSD